MKLFKELWWAAVLNSSIYSVHLPSQCCDTGSSKAVTCNRENRNLLPSEDSLLHLKDDVDDVSRHLLTLSTEIGCRFSLCLQRCFGKCCSATCRSYTLNPQFSSGKNARIFKIVAKIAIKRISVALAVLDFKCWGCPSPGRCKLSSYICLHVITVDEWRR